MAKLEDSSTRRAARLLGASARTLGRTLLHQLPGGDRAQRHLDHWTAIGKDWTQTLGELRGAAMKLGQLASQYADVLPQPLAEQLKRLQNAAEPIPFSQVQQILAQQWTAGQAAAVPHIEPQALAAASIGQVHRAQLADGRAVVVKLRYPGVGEAVDADLRQLRRVIGASKLLSVDAPAMDALMEEVRQRFRDETDYASELRYLQRLRQAAVVEGIVYPEPMPLLCTDGVLVMSEEPGAPLEVARTWPQAVRDRLATRLSYWLLQQMFEARLVHADPHPGNFAFRESGEVVVYDFGCVKALPPAVVDCVRDLLDAGAHQDWDGIHAVLNRLGGLADGVRREKVETLYRGIHEAVAEPLMRTEGFDFADPDFIDRLRGEIRHHIGLSFCFKPVTELMFVLRALSGHYWLMRALAGRVDIRAALAERGLRLR